MNASNELTEINPDDQLNRYEIATGKKRGRPREWTPERITEFKNALLEYIKAEELPQFEEFCLQQGLYPQIIGKLGHEEPTDDERVKSAKAEFRAVVHNLKLFIAGKVSKGVMQGKFNARFAPMYLAHNFGWTAPASTVTNKLQGSVAVEFPTSLQVTFTDSKQINEGDHK